MGFRLDLPWNCAGMKSLFAYIRKDYITLQFSILVKEKKERNKGRKINRIELEKHPSHPWHSSWTMNHSREHLPEQNKNNSDKNIVSIEVKGHQHTRNLKTEKPFAWPCVSSSPFSLL